MQLALKAIRWLAGLIRPTIQGIRQTLPHVLGLVAFVLKELLGGLAIWISKIPETCDKTASHWEDNA